MKALFFLASFLLVLSCTTTPPPPPPTGRPVYNGEEFSIDIRQGIIVECCDCGLRHRIEFRIIDNKTITARYWRLK